MKKKNLSRALPLKRMLTLALTAMIATSMTITPVMAAKKPTKNPQSKPAVVKTTQKPTKPANKPKPQPQTTKPQSKPQAKPVNKPKPQTKPQVQPKQQAPLKVGQPLPWICPDNYDFDKYEKEYLVKNMVMDPAKKYEGNPRDVFLNPESQYSTENKVWQDQGFFGGGSINDEEINRFYNGERYVFDGAFWEKKFERDINEYRAKHGVTKKIKITQDYNSRIIPRLDLTKDFQLIQDYGDYIISAKDDEIVRYEGLSCWDDYYQPRVGKTSQFSRIDIENSKPFTDCMDAFLNGDPNAKVYSKFGSFVLKRDDVEKLKNAILTADEVSMAFWMIHSVRPERTGSISIECEPLMYFHNVK